MSLFIVYVLASCVCVKPWNPFNCWRNHDTSWRAGTAQDGQEPYLTDYREGSKEHGNPIGRDAELAATCSCMAKKHNEFLFDNKVLTPMHSRGICAATASLRAEVLNGRAYVVRPHEPCFATLLQAATLPYATPFGRESSAQSGLWQLQRST